MRGFLALFSVALVSFPAFGAGFKFNPGRYISSGQTYGDVSPKSGVQILRRGDIMVIRDLKNGINYTIDLAKKEEQPLPAKLLEKLRNMPGSRTIGAMIEKITIRDIVTTDDKLEANFVLYLKMDSAFGSLRTRLLIGAQVDSSSCDIVKASFEGGNLKQSEFKGTCLKVESGTHMAVTDLETGLNRELNNVLGLAMDFALRISSPNMSTAMQLFEYR